MKQQLSHIVALIVLVCASTGIVVAQQPASGYTTEAQIRAKGTRMLGNNQYATLGKSSRSDSTHLAKTAMQVIDGDTLYLAWLKEVYVFPPMKFKNKKQERFYWRTVRDVKLTLPYAKLIAKEMERTAEVMSQMDRRQQKKFWKQYEKTLMQQYKVDLSKWTAGQGQMLMKLVDRETGKTSYEVIQMYRGTFIANLWQGVAKLVGNDLKEQYDGADKDQITERIILLVEAGQL